MTTWGWIHVIVGVVAVLAGIGLFTGAVWARAVAVLVAAISILVNFAWLPYYPVWSILIIAFDVFVIWALTAHAAISPLRTIADWSSFGRSRRTYLSRC